MKTSATKILLIEDHADSAESISDYLQKAGFEVILACNGREALSKFEPSIDLIISDLGLPDITGCELLQELTSSRSVPAIALSGYGMPSDREKTKAAGFRAHLIKPISGENLVQRIQDCLVC